MSILTYCNEGCNKAFSIIEFGHEQLNNGIEKTSFNCPHCGYEYVALYTDDETRRLQERIRRVQHRLANPHYDHAAQVKEEAKLKKLIKDKTDALRQKVEHA